MTIELSDQEWEPIDEGILRGEIIGSLKAIKEAAGVRLTDAMSMFYKRYEMLRESRPGEFISEPKEYWKEFYS